MRFSPRIEEYTSAPSASVAPQEADAVIPPPACGFYSLLFRLYSGNGIRIPSHRAETVRRHLQRLSPGCSLRGEGIPVPIRHGRVPPVRRIYDDAFEQGDRQTGITGSDPGSVPYR
jgi:hypothetical protein